MSAALLPEILVAPADEDQIPLTLASEGILRYVWQSRFGPILVEVVGQQAFVNGDPVEPAA